MRTLALLLLLASAAPAAWVSIGPDGGYVQAFAIDPEDPDRLFAACYDYPENARLFRSEDAGASWSMVGRISNYSVSFLALDPFNSDFL